jgi:hypothetical protein
VPINLGFIDLLYTTCLSSGAHFRHIFPFPVKKQNLGKKLSPGRISKGGSHEYRRFYSLHILPPFRWVSPIPSTPLFEWEGLICSSMGNESFQMSLALLRRSFCLGYALPCHALPCRRQGMAWQGMAKRHGKAAWQGMARHGKAWQVVARRCRCRC